MSNKDRDHTKCRKLGTSDICVCCPCGCDTPMDAPNYYELHGPPPEQKEEKATPSTKILTGLQLHRNDCPVRFVNCICNFNADEVFDEVKKMVKEEPRTPKA